MNPCSSSEKEDEEEASSLCFDVISPVSLQLLLVVVFSFSPFLSSAFSSATFKTRHEFSLVSSGSYRKTSAAQRQTEQSVVTFFRTAALYKLEDLLFLKTSCSISRAKDKVSQLRDGVETENNVRKVNYSSAVK